MRVGRRLALGMAAVLVAGSAAAKWPAVETGKAELQTIPEPPRQ